MKIIVLANQLLGEKISSGGDVLSLTSLKRMNQDFHVLGPKASRSSVRDYLGKHHFYSTDNTKIIPSSNFVGGLLIVYLYFLRTVNSVKYISKLKNGQVVYLTGDFLCNSLVAFLIKAFNPQIKVVCNFYHLNPNPSHRTGNIINNTVSFLLQRVSLRVIKKTSDIIFVLSNKGAKELIKIGFNKKDIKVTGAGIDLDKIKKFPKINQKGDAVFLGRLNKSKGIYDALNIIKIITKKSPKFKLLIIGASSVSELKNIKRMAKTMNIESNIEYLGFISEREKYSIMKSTPLLVAPSHEEGYGIGLLEGLACGMFVVAYDLKIYHEVFGEYKKYIKYIKPKDYQSFANAILFFKKQQQSKKQKMRNVSETWENVSRKQQTFFI